MLEKEFVAKPHFIDANNLMFVVIFVIFVAIIRNFIVQQSAAQ